MPAIFSTLGAPSKWMSKVSFPLISNATFSTASTWTKDVFTKMPSLPGSQMASKVISTAWQHPTPVIAVIATGVGLGAYQFIINARRQATISLCHEAAKNLQTKVLRSEAIFNIVNAEPALKAAKRRILTQQKKVLDYLQTEEEKLGKMGFMIAPHSRAKIERRLEQRHETFEEGILRQNYNNERALITFEQLERDERESGTRRGKPPYWWPNYSPSPSSSRTTSASTSRSTSPNRNPDPTDQNSNTLGRANILDISEPTLRAACKKMDREHLCLVESMSTDGAHRATVSEKIKQDNQNFFKAASAWKQNPGRDLITPEQHKYERNSVKRPVWFPS